MKKRTNFLFIEKNDDVYTISMTPELQDDIGTVGFIEFAADGQVNEGDCIANIEASKTVLELEAPFTGMIKEQHQAAVTEPTLLNSSKSEESWVVKMTDIDPKAFEQLEDA